MQARRLPARRGMIWVAAGYRLFRANPPLLTILTFFYLMSAMLLLTLLKDLGVALFSLLQPILLVIIANACRSISTSTKRIPAPDLLAGIRKHSNKLVQLGALQLVGSLLVMLLLFALGVKPDPAKPEELLRALALATAFSSPLFLAFWFAPLLTGWHQLPLFKAIFFSFVAALRNWRAFLVYGLTLGAITLLPAAIAVFAMQVSETFGQILSRVVEIAMVILVVPIFLTGSYISYSDIFTTTQDADV